jgi:ubiquinone/menaquinone biosynthesis C-methylase UbiE
MSLVSGEEKKLDVEQAVKQRYSAASQQAEAALCCSVDYDTNYLKVLPDELVEKDYGCGDPSKYVQAGDTVLDLGAGGGKICYIASQIVGAKGKVIGVDMNDEMLALARRHREHIGNLIGYHNVHFYKGRIQDLALDLETWNDFLVSHPVQSADDWLQAQQEADRMRRESPMIADGSIDVVISNCVLNLVHSESRRSLFDEIYRVLRRGGKAAISDIVCDQPVPQSLRNDPRLWSGCISGAFVEDEFLDAFEQAGFYGIEIATRQEEPWAVVEGIEFRSMTVQAYKGKDGPCLDHRQAVIYRGPWKSVTDDDGHVVERGVRTAVCERTFQIYSQPPYVDQLIPLPPSSAVGGDEAQPMECGLGILRDPRETKQAATLDLLPGDTCCGPESDCC